MAADEVIQLGLEQGSHWADREAVKMAHADPGGRQTILATQEDCMCWIEDARHYTLMFSRRNGSVGLDNRHPAMICLTSAVKLAEVCISFDWWTDEQLVPVMQLGVVLAQGHRVGAQENCCFPRFATCGESCGHCVLPL